MLNNGALNAPGRADSSAVRQLLCLLLLFGLLAKCRCGNGKSVGVNVAQLQMQDGAHKFCGSDLINALDMVCIHGYNTIAKRRPLPLTNAADLELALETESMPQAGYAFSPYLSDIYGTEVLIKTRRLRRDGGGISDECCHKPCTYTELAAYCRQL